MEECYKQAIEDNERTFQDAMSQWAATGDKQYWECMWVCVHKACLYMAKNKCYNIVVRDLEDKVMDATLDVMNKIKNDGVRPSKLSSFCYLYTIGRLWGKKEQRWDRSENVDYYLNVGKYSYDLDETGELITNIIYEKDNLGEENDE